MLQKYRLTSKVDPLLPLEIDPSEQNDILLGYKIPEGKGGMIAVGKWFIHKDVCPKYLGYNTQIEEYPNKFGYKWDRLNGAGYLTKQRWNYSGL